MMDLYGIKTLIGDVERAIENKEVKTLSTSFVKFDYFEDDMGNYVVSMTKEAYKSLRCYLGMEYEDGYNGPARVWLADQDIPGLAMSRSLCDTVAHSVGVVDVAVLRAGRFSPLLPRIAYSAPGFCLAVPAGACAVWSFVP